MSVWGRISGIYLCTRIQDTNPGQGAANPGQAESRTGIKWRARLVLVGRFPGCNSSLEWPRTEANPGQAYNQANPGQAYNRIVKGRIQARGESRTGETRTGIERRERRSRSASFGPFLGRISRLTSPGSARNANPGQALNEGHGWPPSVFGQFPGLDLPLASPGSAKNRLQAAKIAGER